MKTLRLLCLLFTASALVCAASVESAVPAVPVVPAAKTPPKASVPNPFAPRFKQVRDRIDVLFQHRNEPPPPPDARSNPFRTPGATPLPAPSAGPKGGETALAPDMATDLSLLQQSVATLRVSGVFEIAGRSHLVINARPYKEGDVIQTQVLGEAVYLRVREISKRSVTLELNEAQMTLKF